MDYRSRMLFQSPMVLIFLHISYFSFWQSKKSGSVLALARRVDGFI